MFRTMKNRYPIRAAKYFVYLLILFVLLFGLLLATDYTSWQTFAALAHSGRIWLLAAAFVVLPALYPLIGYLAREMNLDYDKRRELIERVLAMNGYRIVSETPDGLVCRAAGGMKRAALMFEDRIVIRRDGRGVRIEGPRKEVVRLEYRINTFM
jgi:hypothetical protein